MRQYSGIPDMIGKIDGKVWIVGEVESSPFNQVVVAGLGHLASLDTMHILGITLSHDRNVDLYMFSNTMPNNDGRIGPVHFTRLTMKSLKLVSHEFFQEIAKALHHIHNYKDEEGV